MILPMKKIFLVTEAKDRREASEALREFGNVHVSEVRGQGPSYEGAQEAVNNLYKAINTLQTLKSGKAPGSREIANTEEAASIAQKIQDTQNKIAELTNQLVGLKKEEEELTSWGSYTVADFNELSDCVRSKIGTSLLLCEGPLRELEKIPANLNYIILQRSKKLCRLLVLKPEENSDDPIAPPALPAGFSEFNLHTLSLSEIRAQIKSVQDLRQQLENHLASYRGYLAALKKFLPEFEGQAEFESVVSGMDEHEQFVYLSGFIPEADVPALKQHAQKNAWALLIRDPNPDELPPSKLHNNIIVRSIAPVFNFLGINPNYREYDISSLFLLYFIIFFAMLFSDAGYGILLFASAVIIAIRSKRAGKAIPDAIILLFMLSSALIIWGTLTGVWFGVAMEKLPSFLQQLTLPIIASNNPAAGDNIKIFCFFLGTVQLSMAHILNIWRDRATLKFLAQVGSLSMLLGMISVVLFFVIGAEHFPIPTIALILIGSGFGLNFIFAEYSGDNGFLRGILGGILASAKNIISVLLGVVNVFADIVSYIRLWAVGLAGGAISEVLNGFAGPMLGHFAFFIFALILLVFGHSFNIILSVLSVIVHGVRLNMLEFSSHLGMEWSGYSYRPFKKNK